MGCVMTTSRRHSDEPLLPATLLSWWLATTTAWWWLAFARLEAAPEWLRRAQSVCFGTMPSGLPDDYGWITLALAPLSILLGLLTLYGNELSGSFGRLCADTSGKLLVVGLLGAASLQAGVTAARVVDAREAAVSARTLPISDEDMPETYPRLGRAAPALDLMDDRGAHVTLASLAGRPFVVAFTFAHCQTVCPALVQQVREASAEFPVEVPILYVTLDPWRDTPSSLPTIAKRWGLVGSERVLSGPVDEVTRVLDAFNVPRARDEDTGDVSHPALAYVIDGEGAVAFALEGPTLSWLPEAVRRAGERGGDAFGVAARVGL